MTSAGSGEVTLRVIKRQPWRMYCVEEKIRSMIKGQRGTCRPDQEGRTTTLNGLLDQKSSMDKLSDPQTYPM